jgi:hypothetical protein
MGTLLILFSILSKGLRKDIATDLKEVQLVKFVTSESSENFRKWLA